MRGVGKSKGLSGNGERPVSVHTRLATSRAVVIGWGGGLLAGGVYSVEGLLEKRHLVHPSPRGRIVHRMANPPLTLLRTSEQTPDPQRMRHVSLLCWRAWATALEKVMVALALLPAP